MYPLHYTSITAPIRHSAKRYNHLLSSAMLNAGYLLGPDIADPRFLPSSPSIASRRDRLYVTVRRTRVKFILQSTSTEAYALSLELTCELFQSRISRKDASLVESWRLDQTISWPYRVITKYICTFTDALILTVQSSFIA